MTHQITGDNVQFQPNSVTIGGASDNLSQAWNQSLSNFGKPVELSHAAQLFTKSNTKGGGISI